MKSIQASVSSSVMNLDFHALSQTCDVNEFLHYPETFFSNDNYCASSQQLPKVEGPTDSSTTLQDILNDYYNMDNIEGMLNFWQWEPIGGKSAPEITQDKQAAIVPDIVDISCATQDVFCGRNPFIFPEPENTSKLRENLALERNNLTRQPNYDLDKNMQDFSGKIIFSSTVSTSPTSDNQVAVVPSTDSNVHVPTHAAFLPENILPAEDIPKCKDVSSARNRMTQDHQTPTFLESTVETFQNTCRSFLQSESAVQRCTTPDKKPAAQKRGLKRAAPEHEVPSVPPPPRGRKRVQKPLKMYNGRGTPQLWQFILQLLINAAHTDDVCWTHQAPFEFKFLRPGHVAKLWGEAKGKANMNYENLSRGIRYYYDKNIISKDNRGKTHVYRFVCDIISILGYDPTACTPKHDSSVTPKPCSTEAGENNMLYSTQDQRNPLSFVKTEVNPNPGNAFDKYEIASEEIISNFAAYAAGAPFDGNKVNLFPSEFTCTPVDAEFQFSPDYLLETLHHQQLSGLNALSFEV